MRSPSSSSRKTPERTTAEAFPRYLGGEVLADSATLKWPGLFVRRYRFPRVVDGFLVPATSEPLITCQLDGSAEFQERDIGGAWVPRQVRRGDIFVTGSKTPYELRWRSPLGAEIDVIHIHLGVDAVPQRSLKKTRRFSARIRQVERIYEGTGTNSWSVLIPSQDPD